jgi:hypothetical protein
MTLPRGIKVKNLTKGDPGNNLPSWVKEISTTRGYGDAVYPLSLYVTDEDIDRAFEEVAHGDGNACAMAQAGSRLGAQRVYFYRTTAWVDFGDGPILRFSTGSDVYRHVIEPFDRGVRPEMHAGIYHLLPPNKSKSLATLRTKKTDPERKGTGSTNPKPYMGRVVMGAIHR